MNSLVQRLPIVQPRWRWTLVVSAVLIALMLLAYRDTAAAMVGIWIRSETFTHAFVVPPLALWLIWRKRAELERLTPRPAAWMLLPLVLLAAMWWVGQLALVNAATQFALVAMVVMTVPLLAGWQVTRALAFPLAFMFFSVPFGEFLTPTLMHWTAEVVVISLRLTGIPVVQEGQQLVIPSGRWAVVEACSGIRYLMASFMVGSLFAYLNYRSTRRRLIFVVVSILLPILANWVRAYIIVMLGHLSNNAIATGADHLVYGWVFFGVVVMAMFFIGARWAEDDEPLPAAAAGSAQAPGSGAGARTGALVMVAALGVLASQWPLWLMARGAPTDDRPALRVELPEALGAWQALPAQGIDWKPQFVGANRILARTYHGPQGATVGVSVSYYRQRDGGGKLVSSSNMLVPSNDALWHVVGTGRAAVPAVAGGTWRSATLLGTDDIGASGDNKRRLTVWQLYWVGGHLTASDAQAKLWQAWLAMRGEPDDAAAVHVSSTLPDDAAAAAQLRAFVGENFDMLQRTLMQARAGR